MADATVVKEEVVAEAEAAEPALEEGAEAEGEDGAEEEEADEVWAERRIPSRLRFPPARLAGSATAETLDWDRSKRGQ